MMRGSMFDPSPHAAALSHVHHWLVYQGDHAVGALPRASLAIEHFGGDVPPLALRLAEHLAEYDGCGEEAWLFMDEALTELVRFDFSSQRLLGLDGNGDHQAVALLSALLRRGRVIVEMPGALEMATSLENCFRVALAPMGDVRPGGFHLAIDPLKFQRDCLISVIGDAFLEWMHDREITSMERRAVS